MKAINYYFWGIANRDTPNRLAYLEGLTRDLRTAATEAGFGTITEAVEAGALARRAVRDQGIGE